jgi:hypothetical protein
MRFTVHEARHRVAAFGLCWCGVSHDRRYCDEFDGVEEVESIGVETEGCLKKFKVKTLARLETLAACANDSRAETATASPYVW